MVTSWSFGVRRVTAVRSGLPTPRTLPSSGHTGTRGGRDPSWAQVAGRVNKCRHHVTSIESTAWLDDVKVSPVTVMRYRPDNVNDSCCGWMDGDSGGPVYFSHWSGSGWVAHGLISGSTDECPSNGSRNYYSSELWGVGKWADVAGTGVGIPLWDGTYAWWP